MIEISSELVKEIARSLDGGVMCFYHTTRGELLKGSLRGATDPESYLRFEVPDQTEYQRMMEGFIREEVQDQQMQERLFRAIGQKKSLNRFNWAIIDDPELRQEWLAYKEYCLEEYVRKQIAGLTKGQGPLEPQA